MSPLGLLVLILVIVWLSGYAGWPYAGYRGNNVVHIILVIALIIFFVQLLGGRRIL